MNTSEVRQMKRAIAPVFSPDRRPGICGTLSPTSRSRQSWLRPPDRRTSCVATGIRALESAATIEIRRALAPYPALRAAVLVGASLFALIRPAAAEQVHVYRLSPMAVAPDNAVPEGLESISTPISMRIAPGQLDDLVLAVTQGNSTLRNVRLVASRLHGPEGHFLEVPDERVRNVVCWYGPKGGIGGPPDWDARDSFMYEPYALLYDASLIRANHKKKRTEITYKGFPDDNPPIKPRDVPAGEMRQWYVTIPVPADAPPGEYKGRLSFVSGNVVVRMLALFVEVLPIKLLPSAKLYGMYTNLRPGLELDDPRYLMMLKDLAEHGFHNPWLLQSRNRVTVDRKHHWFFRDIEEAMALRYQAGLDMDFVIWAGSGIALHVSQDQRGYHLRYVEGNKKLAKELATYWNLRPDFPPLVIYGYDELHGEPLRELASTTYKALVEAGLSVGSACSPGYLEYTDKWMSYPIMLGTLSPGAVSKADAARARAQGATILSYSGPQLIYHDPFLYRLRTGLNLWTSIYDGWFPFTYAWRYADHENGKIVTTGRTVNFKAHGVVLLGKDRIIPQVEWPAMRQGVDDVRYATTLAAQVLKARELGIRNETVAEAEKLARRPLGGPASVESIEAARERITDAILALQTSDARLQTGKLGGKEPKAVARKVNQWILPDLSFREFPMGLTELGEMFQKMKAHATAGQAYEATMLGYRMLSVLREAQEAGKIKEVEFFIAKGKAGSLLLAEEKKSLEIIGDAYLKHFDLVKDISDGWVFRPDRDDLGVKEGWFRAGKSRSGWQPINVQKFWQQQGVQDWVQLEGPRVGMMGIGWYAQVVAVPPDWRDRDLCLWFNSDEDAMVWVNDQLVRVRDEGPPTVRWHTPSLAPLKHALEPGEKNEIVVRVYNMGQAGGLWRGVRVIEPKKRTE